MSYPKSKAKFPGRRVLSPPGRVLTSFTPGPCCRTAKHATVRLPYGALSPNNLPDSCTFLYQFLEFYKTLGGFALISVFAFLFAK